MAANIAQVVRTGAAQRKGFRVFIILNVNFIVNGVVIVFHPENGRAKKVVMLYQVNKAKGMDFLTAANHFIRARCVNIFYKVW